MSLKGLKVLEFAGLAPVPFCGMLLADFGASVIRIDKTHSPDLAMYDVLGNGKRSIALDLKSESAVNIIKRLCKNCDVIIEPYRKGTMEKLKLGPSDLMKINEKLIYARLTGYGQHGPYAKVAGHDINFLSLSGILSLIGRFNEKPLAPSNLFADFAGGGLMCAFGILLALHERNYSQKGQIVDSSMVNGAAYLGSWFYRIKKIEGFLNKPRGKNMLDTGSHWYDTYETKDGEYMSVGCLEPQFYDIFLKKLGLSQEEWPQFEKWEESKTKLTEIFKTKTQAEWCSIFEGSDACVTPVLNFDNVSSHKHNQSQNNFTISKDDLVIPQVAPRLSRTPGISCATKTPNIIPGEHTVEILMEYNYSLNEIEDFLTNGIAEQSEKKSKL